jgi:hypothetical protein
VATQLQLVNTVLTELREDNVTTINESAYSQLIAQFVNRAKEWMEDVNHNWSVYITEIDTTILADSSTVLYDLTATNDRSVLLRDQEQDWLPAAYDITTGEAGQLFDCPYSDLKRARIMVNDTSKVVVNPRVFSVVADSDGRGWSYEIIWPVDSAEAARTWRSYWYVPQAKLALDNTDVATEVLLPRNPIELRALYLALNERGEEMGQPGGIAMTDGENALGSALEIDQQVQSRGQVSSAKDWNNNECL